jgi:autotransporter-associated beta strand protein
MAYAHGTFKVETTFTVGSVLADNEKGANPELWGGTILTKTGQGILTLTQANTYTGGTEIKAGTINIGNSSALGDGLVTITGGSTTTPTTLDFIAKADLDDLDPDYTLTNAFDLKKSGNNADATFNTGGYKVTLEGQIIGTGNLVKIGAGKLTLDNTGNAYVDTTINAGTLSISSNDNLGTGTNTLDGGTLQLTGEKETYAGWTLADAEGNAIETVSDVTFGALTGEGGFIKKGTGKLILSAANDYEGDIAIDAGTLEISSTGSLGSSGNYNGTITSTSTALIFDGTTQTLTDVISGTSGSPKDFGSLTVTNSGTSFDRVDVYGSPQPTDAILAPAVYPAGAIYEDTLNVQNGTLNFYVPASTSASAIPTLLTVMNDANIADAQVNVGVYGSTPLKLGETILLLKAAGTLETPKNAWTNGEGMQGVTLKVLFDLIPMGNELWAKVSGISAREESKALSEGFISGLIGINQGIDLVAGAGISALNDVTSSNGQNDGNHTFMVVDGNDTRYHTGSHVDLKSRTLLVGLASEMTLDAGHLAVGAFVTHGEGDYDTFNSFANSVVKSQGETRYTGAGLLAELDLPSKKGLRPYIETSFQAGRTETDFQSSDLLPGAPRVQYKTRSNYAGAHVGVDAVWGIPDVAALNLYGKYLYTHRSGDKLNLDTGDPTTDAPIEFDAVESKRLRFGGRYTWTMKRAQPYVGAAWEREYDSETRATSYGQSIEAPSLEGITRTMEFGMPLCSSPTNPLSLDINVQRHSGKREGTSGSVQIKYWF